MDASVSLTLGHVLRFESEAPFYGQVIAVENGPAEEKYLARLRIFYGKPDFCFDTAQILSEKSIPGELKRFLPENGSPFRLSSPDKKAQEELGALILLNGKDEGEIRKCLPLILKEFQGFHQNLVIDPTGRYFVSQDGFPILCPTQDFKLSLQTYGLNRFVSLIAEQIPEGLQEDALRLLAKQIPPTPDFIPFRHFLRPERFSDVPVKNLLLHQLYQLYLENIFADAPQEVLSFNRLAKSMAVVLDLSLVPLGWPGRFYGEIIRHIAQTQEMSGKLLTLIHPDVYLKDWELHVQCLRDQGIHLVLVLANPQKSSSHLYYTDEFSFNPPAGIIFQGTHTHNFPYPVTMQRTGHHDTGSHGAKGHPDDQKYQAFRLPEETGSASPASGHVNAFTSFDFENIPASLPQTQPESMEFQIFGPESFESEETDDNEEDLSPTATPVMLSPDPFAETQEAYLPSPHASFSQAGSSEAENIYTEDWYPPQPEWGAVHQDHDSPFHPVSEGHSFELQKALEDIPDEDFLTFTSEPSGTFEPALPQEQAPVHHEYGAADSEPDFHFQPTHDSPPLHTTLLEETEEFSFNASHETLDIPETHEEIPEIPHAAETPETYDDDDTDGPQQETIPVYRVHEFEQQQIAEQVGFHEGERIRHEKYGIGVVNKVIPMESSVVLNVTFDSVGKRLLDPTLSRIEKV